jgi:hypothetical protein
MGVFRARRRLALVVCIAALPLGGCGFNRIQSQSRVNPTSMAVYTHAKSLTGCPLVPGSRYDQNWDAIDLDCFQFPEDRTAIPAGATRDANGNPVVAGTVRHPGRSAYARAAADKAARNRLTSILIKQSDDICTLELGRLTANEAMTNTGLSILGTGLATAASIVTGDLAQSILSGSSALVGASRDHINVHVYRNTVAQAVTQVIASERKTRATEIMGNYAKTIADWSIDDAIRQVNGYHGQCSFYKGLELLLKAADNNTDLQAFRTERAQQAQRDRIDEELNRLTAGIRGLSGSDRAALETRVKELLLARSRIGTGPGVQDAPPPVTSGNADADADGGGG